MQTKFQKGANVCEARRFGPANIILSVAQHCIGFLVCLSVARSSVQKKGPLGERHSTADSDRLAKLFGCDFGAR